MSSTRPGHVLAGKYRVESVLGSGGMGYVVAARHLQLDQMVAMKFLRRNVSTEAPLGEATARFVREAKAVVKLRSEHVARVFDIGTLETGEPYIVMEHLEGRDLAAIAKERGSIGTSEAAELVLQACAALGEAHGLGIVHRDIKLSNLFVTRGPAGAPLLKVLDFGISKTSPFGESEAEITRRTTMLGSPQSMSPEQMRDPRAVDARTDIWSLGVVLYRLVGGRSPFEGDSLGRVFAMVLHEREPPLSTLRPDLPPGFGELVARCLEKDPAQRFANVAELAYALVPYCVEPQRARAAADRIAATLSLPRAVSLGDASMSWCPPIATDVASVAPWAGTPRTTHVPLPTRGGVLAIAALGFALLVAGVTLASRRAEPTHSVRAATSEPTASATEASTSTSNETSLAMPPLASTAPVMATPDIGTPAAAIHPLVLTTSAPAGAAPSVAPAAVRTPPAKASTASRAPVMRSKTKAPPEKARRDDGIPNSRD